MPTSSLLRGNELKEKRVLDNSLGATRQICKEQSDGIAKRPHADLVLAKGKRIKKEKGRLLAPLELLGGFVRSKATE